MVAATDPLVLLQASCHGPTLDTRTLRFALGGEVGADVVNFSEAYHHRPWLLDRERWRASFPPVDDGDDRDTLRGKNDAPVLVRRRYPQEDEWWRLMCHRSAPLRLAPPRYANAQTFVHPLGLVESTAFHPHAKIRGLPADLPRVVEYRRGMDRLERHLAHSIERGRLVIGSGDLNYPDVDGPEWSPRRVFARLGLRTWSVGVDWVWWTPRLVLVDRKVYARDQTRQDHPWLRASWTGFVR